MNLIAKLNQMRKMEKKTARKHTQMRIKKHEEKKNPVNWQLLLICTQSAKIYLFFSLYFCKMYLWIQIKNENETKSIQSMYRFLLQNETFLSYW